MNRKKEEIKMLLTLVSIVQDKIKSYLRYRRTVYELNQLTTRDLRDLGIDRCDIEFIAWNTAHGGRN
jgi:uncharacterized protein YjiS (DUF1127 family)